MQSNTLSKLLDVNITDAVIVCAAFCDVMYTPNKEFII